jgi:hypothetical protein
MSKGKEQFLADLSLCEAYLRARNFTPVCDRRVKAGIIDQVVEERRVRIPARRLDDGTARIVAKYLGKEPAGAFDQYVGHDWALDSGRARDVETFAQAELKRAILGYLVEELGCGLFPAAGLSEWGARMVAKHVDVLDRVAVMDDETLAQRVGDDLSHVWISHSYLGSRPFGDRAEEVLTNGRIVGLVVTSPLGDIYHGLRLYECARGDLCREIPWFRKAKALYESPRSQAARVYATYAQGRFSIDRAAI